ncbi:MAG: creatininase family protein [Bacteroidota bacterium]
MPDIRLVQNWRSITVFEDGGDHANEMETSVILYIRPDLILPLFEEGEGVSKQYSIESFRAGQESAQCQWSIGSEDASIGNQKKANTEKEKRYLDHLVKKIGAFFIKLSKKRCSLNEVSRQTCNNKQYKNVFIVVISYQNYCELSTYNTSNYANSSRKKHKNGISRGERERSSDYTACLPYFTANH